MSLKERFETAAKEAEAAGNGPDQGGGQPNSQKTDQPAQPPQQPADQPNTPNAEPPKVEYNDDSVLAYINKQKGKEFKSLDEAFAIPEPKPLEFANQDVEKFNEYTKRTGRGLDDYYRFMKDDSDAKDADLVRQHYKNQGYTDREIDVKFGLDLKELTEDEGYDQNDIDSRSRLLTEKGIILKEEAARIKKERADLRESLNTVDEKYKQQQESQTAGIEGWKQSVEEVSKSIDLGIEGYKYEADPEKLVEKYGDPAKVLDRFKDKDGNFSYDKMIKGFEILENFEAISQVLAKQSAAKAEKDLITGMENPEENKGKPNPNAEYSQEEKEFREGLKRTGYKR